MKVVVFKMNLQLKQTSRAICHRSRMLKLLLYLTYNSKREKYSVISISFNALVFYNTFDPRLEIFISSLMPNDDR